MGQNSKIEWTDATWNPVRGCSMAKGSELGGCLNCYAAAMASRFGGSGGAFEGFARIMDSGPRWTGKVELIEKHLNDPLRWRNPKRIFVNSMSDLFHENLDTKDVLRVFEVMRAAPWHTYQVLTKRPDQMLDCVTRLLRNNWHGAPPLENVWLGVSVEDQKTADARIPLLLQTPAAVRFVSYEPALGTIDFDDTRDWLTPNSTYRKREMDGCMASLDQIIVGGESGPRARPFDIAWVRNTIAQCESADVACFVKQLGANPLDSSIDLAEWPKGAKGEPGKWRPILHDRKGGDMEEWSTDLRVREMPERR